MGTYIVGTYIVGTYIVGTYIVGTYIVGTRYYLRTIEDERRCRINDLPVCT